MNQAKGGIGMALRQVRLDVGKEVKVVDAFMGVGLHSKYVGGAVESVHVDGRPVKFTVVRVTTPVIEEHKDASGTRSSQIRVRVNAVGLYDETLELEFVYSTFKDRVYRQDRPEQATVELRCSNLGDLKYPPKEIYTMVSATFSDI